MAKAKNKYYIYKKINVRRSLYIIYSYPTIKCILESVQNAKSAIVIE